MLCRFYLVIIILVTPLTAFGSERPVVVVAGATGETGVHVVRALSVRGFEVRGLVRDAAGAQSQHGGIAAWMIGDVRNPSTLAPIFAGADYAVSVIGSREREGSNSFENVDWLGNRNLIDAAKAAGVKSFVLTTSGSAGTGDFDDPEVKRFGAGRIWKGKAEAYLRESGLMYTIVAPGGLRNYAGGNKGIAIKPRNEYKVGVIARADVAVVIVECITNPACAQKTLTVINTDDFKPDAWIETLPALPLDTPATIRIPDRQ